MNNLWDSMSEVYAAELETSTTEIHFGVGIPGNNSLGLILPTKNGVAIDLGCGSGENLVALSRLGYRVVGVDSSEAQLASSRKLLDWHGIKGALVLGEVCGKTVPAVENNADIILSVGVAHFCFLISDFISNCASLLRPNGYIVLSVPHPVDMITRVEETDGKRTVSIQSYFPASGRILNAHYWQQFAGRISLAKGLIEYLWKPSDIVNSMLSSGFELQGVWEPQYRAADAPCRFRNPDPWFAENFFPNVPQYLIVKARRKSNNE